MTRSPRPAAALAGFALVIGSLGLAAPAGAAAPDTEPCAKEQRQADRAQASLERVSAVFAKQKQKVKEAKDEVEDAEDADDADELDDAAEDLEDAKVKKDKVKANKRAQQQRVAKTQERLANCQGEPEEAPTTEG